MKIEIHVHHHGEGDKLDRVIRELVEIKHILKREHHTEPKLTLTSGPPVDKEIT